MSKKSNVVHRRYLKNGEKACVTISARAHFGPPFRQRWYPSEAKRHDEAASLLGMNRSQYLRFIRLMYLIGMSNPKNAQNIMDRVGFDHADVTAFFEFMKSQYSTYN